MVKLQEFKGQMFLTLPKQLARAKDLKKGQELSWKLDNMGRLFLLEEVG